MTNFHERQKSLFNHLKNAEELCKFSKPNKTVQEQDFDTIDKHTYRKVKHEMRQFRGKESIFKRPDANIRECLRAKSIPGYIKNPKKWVYYTLSDVTPDQMSDQTNTATALALLRDMEEKESINITDSLTMDMDCDNVFKKPTYRPSSTFKKVNSKDQCEAVIIKSNKIIMPEYVVGLSKKKEKTNKLIRRNSQGKTDNIVKKAELKLDHLYGDDSDE